MSVTEEGFQAEPLLLADPEAGVGECVVEDLGKGVRSGGAMSEERCARPTPSRGEGIPQLPGDLPG